MTMKQLVKKLEHDFQMEVIIHVAVLPSYEILKKAINDDMDSLAFPSPIGVICSLILNDLHNDSNIKYCFRLLSELSVLLIKNRR